MVSDSNRLCLDASGPLLSLHMYKCLLYRVCWLIGHVCSGDHPVSFPDPLGTWRWSGNETSDHQGGYIGASQSPLFSDLVCHYLNHKLHTIKLEMWHGNHVTVRFGATKAVKNIPQCVCSYPHLLLHIKYLKSCTTIGSCDSLCIYCWVWHLNSIHCYLKLNYS